MGWTAPYGNIVADSRQGPTMDQIIRIGMDTSKHSFQLHGVNSAEEPVVRRKFSRGQMLAFFARQPSTVIGLEAGGAAHHWSRTLSAMGHEVKIIAPQFVKPYVKRGKNDAADAEALCEAMSRPSMRFVAPKTAEQRDARVCARSSGSFEDTANERYSRACSRIRRDC